MTLRNSKPTPYTPKGLTDAIDVSHAFDGAMVSLANLIPDPGERGLYRCRPASTSVTTFTGYNTPGFISCLYIVGSYAFGLISSARNPGQDEPFMYNFTTSTFTTITGVTSANTPASPSSSGTWVPPTACLVGQYVLFTSPGFNTVSGYYFGWINVTNPAAPTWSAGTLTGAVTLPTQPTAIAQFNGRAYYAVNNAMVFSDTTSPLNCTSGNQVLVIGTNQVITALVGMPLQNQVQGGVIQSLIAFVGINTMYQITGDAVGTGAAALALNQLNISTGTWSQNAVCATPQGLCFVSPEGLRFIDQTAQVSEPVGANGQGIARPFYYALFPSRISIAYADDTIRVTLQNGYLANIPFQEYFYHLSSESWSGPHSFPASLIQPYGSQFVLAPVAVTGQLFQSQVSPGLAATYVENGIQLSWTYQTPLIPPSSGAMCENNVQEQTISLSMNGSDQYYFAWLSQTGTILSDTYIMAQGSETLWGAFLWGHAPWLGTSLQYSSIQLAWAAPVVFKKAVFYGIGPSSQFFTIAGTEVRLEELGYLIQPVDQMVSISNANIVRGSVTFPNGTSTYTFGILGLTSQSQILFSPALGGGQNASTLIPFIQIITLTPSAAIGGLGTLTVEFPPVSANTTLNYEITL